MADWDPVQSSSCVHFASTYVTLATFAVCCSTQFLELFPGVSSLRIIFLKYYLCLPSFIIM